jgi:hypothetical protein
MTKKPNRLEFDIEELSRALGAIDTLEGRLIEITNRSWQINLNVTGTGSSELPIMEKIEEISNAFEKMGSNVGQMYLQMNLSQIHAQIEQTRQELWTSSITPAGGTGSWDWEYMKKQKEGREASLLSQLTSLQQTYEQLSKGNFGGNGGGGYGGTGGVSINIGVINIVGGSDMEIAEKLDSALADLWMKDRSKLKGMIT